MKSSPDSYTSTNHKQLEKAISQQLTKETTQLITKIKQAKIDPFGFGLYARALQYRNWVTHENNWTQELSKSKINIRINIKVRDIGNVK